MPNAVGTALPYLTPPPVPLAIELGLRQAILRLFV
jgi:hypothetical protein